MRENRREGIQTVPSTVLSPVIFALVRTDPDAKKQEGITFILIDMESPGVSVKPILLISGKSPFGSDTLEKIHELRVAHGLDLDHAHSHRLKERES